MYPYQHFIACSILAAVIWPFYGISSMIVFLGGFFIDIDHNIWYMYKEKDWRGWRAYRYYTDGVKHNRKFGKSVMIFHTIEFIIPVAALSFLFLPVLLFLYGMSLHLLMDGIWKVKNNMFDERMLSVIYELLTKK